MLGLNAAAGIFFADSVPGHKPCDTLLPGGGYSSGHIAKLREVSFKESDGIDSSQPWLAFQTAQHLFFDRRMGDGVQVQQGLRIGKDDGTQLFALKAAAFFSRFWTA